MVSDKIEEQLDIYLEAALSSRRSSHEPATRIARLQADQQAFVLHWVKIISHTNAEMAFQIANHAPAALRLMDQENVTQWIIQAMDIYDKKGLLSGISILHKPDQFADIQNKKNKGIDLAEVKPVLENFLHGLNGRSLSIQADEQTYTDTEILYLPALISHYPTKAGNFLLYKATLVHLWSQTWLGTWGIDFDAHLQPYPDQQQALRWFNIIETTRLNLFLEAELPGIHRQMKKMETDSQHHIKLQHQLNAQSTREDSWALLNEYYAKTPPMLHEYQGQLFPDQVKRIQEDRINREKQTLQFQLSQFLKEQNSLPTTPDQRVKQLNIEHDNQEVSFTLQLESQAIPPPNHIQTLLTSIYQDFGEIPPEYLVAAGSHEYDPNQPVNASKNPKDVWKGTYHEEGAFIYNEWDYERQHHRKGWCVLRELEILPADESFYDQTLQKYGGLIKSIRRTFEALRGEDKTLKNQPMGDDIDIDAFVKSYADHLSGMEMSANLFTKKHREERNTAVMFMVDMSGSTKGWINNAEREALILICEALETLGDQYAIYGFSGITRKRCEIYRIKAFEQPYNPEVKARITGIKPKDYTRMGVAVRHLSQKLNEIEARTRILITLSDGKPDDYDSYRGKYGIEDTRQALLEAIRSGIHPFCITIDESAKSYLPHMYGQSRYIVIDDVAKLPLKVSDIYRKLIT